MVKLAFFYIATIAIIMLLYIDAKIQKFSIESNKHYKMAKVPPK